MSDDAANVETDPIALKLLLQQRHLATHAAFRREYDKVAATIDRSLVGSCPSKAQFYRWLSGELVGLPYPDHCRILEGMLPGWLAPELFSRQPSASFRSQSAATSKFPGEVVAFYPHRADTPRELWMDLLTGAMSRIDLFANASLFLPEENPDAIRILGQKAAAGVSIRILLADPDDPAMMLRGREERLFDSIPARIRMALAYYRPLVGVDGIEFHLHGTSLYNSIFRYDDQMLVNQHIYGTYGYVAPVLHLREQPSGDLFATYMRSLDMVWNEESRDIQTPSTLHVEERGQEVG